MVSYIQPTNRNSFTLRFKKYKRLRKDIWGRLALQNKKNYVTALIRTYAERDLRNRIRKLPRRKKFRILRKFKFKRRYHQFRYQLKEKPRVLLGKPYPFRIAMKILGRSLIRFYYLRKKRKSLRKLFSSFRPGRTPDFFLEKRADTLFLRANFVDSILQARQFIKHKQLAYLNSYQKKKNAFISQKTILKPYTQIPIFTFFKLSPFLAFKRKTVLYHALLSRNKFISLPPKWLLVNYRLLIALTIRIANNIKYIYPSAKTSSHFSGIIAKYL
jgi:ribosomal protein S4